MGGGPSPVTTDNALERVRDDDPALTECRVVIGKDFYGKTFSLQWLTAFAEALAHNTNLRELILWFTDHAEGGERALQVLCTGIQRNCTLKKLELHGAPEASCPAVCEALTRHTSITSLRLRACGDPALVALCPALATLPNLQHLSLQRCDISSVGLNALLPVIEDNSNLTEIDLHGGLIGDDGVAGLCKAILRHKRIRQLCLRGTAVSDAGVAQLCDCLAQCDEFDYLDIFGGDHFTNASAHCLGELKAHFPNMRLWTRVREELIEEAAQAARDRAALLLEFGAAPATKARLILCGHQHAGKTCLAASLCGEPLPVDKKRLSTDPLVDLDADGRTAGVDVRSVELLGGGTFALNDLAGQSQYFTPHSLLMQGRAVLVLAVSLATPKSERQQQLEFWLRFLKARFVPVSATELPRVHVVLTHRDVAGLHRSDAAYDQYLQEWVSAWGEGAVEHYREQFRRSLAIDPKVYVVDSFEAEDGEMDALRDALRSSRGQILRQADAVPAIVERISQLLESLRKTHGRWPIRTEAEFWADLRSQDPSLPDVRRQENQSDITGAVFRFLQSEGEVVWAKEAGLVVLSPPFLCSHIVGRLFAPEWFSVHVKQAVAGHVTKEAVAAVFPRQDVDQILAIVSELDLGFAQDDSTFLLPALLENEEPAESQWAPPPGAVVLGRRLLCTTNTDYFGPTFAPRLQVRLKRVFGQHLTLWKGGADGAKAGIRCRVVASHNGQGLDVWVHDCGFGIGVAVLSLIEDVLDEVMKVQFDDCVNTAPVLLALSPSRLLAEGATPDTVPGYLMKELEATSAPGASPTHPGAAGPIEPITLLLGRPQRVFTELWPCAALGLTHGKLRVLVIRSNSQQFDGIGLDTDKEERLIRQAARRSRHHDFIEIKGIGDVTPNDIAVEMASFRPHCVHLVGHHKATIGFECVESDVKCYLSGTQFRVLLSHIEPPLQLACLVINACKSLEFVQQLGPATCAAVCTSSSPLDAQAFAFAQTFWRALFEGENIDDSFGHANQAARSATLGTVNLRDPGYQLLKSTDDQPQT